MRQSDERPQPDSSPAQPAPLASGAILGDAKGIPAQTAPAQTVAPPLDPGPPPLPTLATQSTGHPDGSTATERQTAEGAKASNNLSPPLALTPPTRGGFGGTERADAAPSRADASPTPLAAILDHDRPPGKLANRSTRLLERAIRERWDIPPGIAAELPTYLAEVLRDTHQKPETRLKAAKGLMGAQAQNLALVRTAIEAERASNPASGAPAVTVTVNVDASGPLARIKRLQGESGESGESGSAAGG